MPDETSDVVARWAKEYAPKPVPESPRLTAARTLLEKTPAALRDTVGAELIRNAADPDEVMAMHALVAEHLDADAQAADEELVGTVREALKPAESASPYLDDARLRDPAGNESRER
jgi:hypothetical protein